MSKYELFFVGLHIIIVSTKGISVPSVNTMQFISTFISLFVNFLIISSLFLVLALTTTSPSISAAIFSQ